MESVPFTEIEFIGGPEDGRRVGTETLRELMREIGSDDYSIIPVAARLTPERGPRDPAKMGLIGQYLAKQIEGKTLQYVWGGPE